MTSRVLRIEKTAQRRVLIPRHVALPTSFAALRALRVREIVGATMGTTWCVKIAVPVAYDTAPLHRQIEAVFKAIIGEMSPWEPRSHISRFNGAPHGTWHELPSAFLKVLVAALDWAARTNGAYDPTVGAAVDLWGFGPSARRAGLPSDRDIESARANMGWRRLVLDAEQSRAFQPGGLALDLSSIAKGFTVDEVARILRRNAIANFLVEIGGELRGEGLKPDGTPWWVELEPSRGGAESSIETRIALSGLAVATSGDSQRYVEWDGRRYAHTLDPRTAKPLTHDLVSVTALASDCMTADAAATALLVLGPEAGPAFAARHDLAARFVSLATDGPTERLSPAMAAMLD